MPTITTENLTEFSRQVLMKAGAPSGIAERVARGLVLSNLKGVDSHGVIRLLQYVSHVNDGLIIPDALPEVLSETPTSAVVDAHQGYGHVGAGFSTEIAIAKARASGVAAVTLRHTRHIGRLGEYVEMAIEAGFVGVACCSAVPLAAPYGGRKASLGSNPLAIGLPSDLEFPFVLDWATSVMSEGKVRVYRELEKPLPEGVILDPAGAPSTNPADFYAHGALLPMATYKGYGLSLAIEILGAVLAGGGTALIHEPVEGLSTFGNGGVFVVLDPARFGDPALIRAETGAVCRAIKNVPLQDGFTEILVPGEPEYRAQREREHAGIPIPDSLWETLRKAAVELGVPPETLSAN